MLWIHMILDVLWVVALIAFKFLLMLVWLLYRTLFNPTFGKVSAICPLEICVRPLQIWGDWLLTKSETLLLWCCKISFGFGFFLFCSSTRCWQFSYPTWWVLVLWCDHLSWGRQQLARLEDLWDSPQTVGHLLMRWVLRQVFMNDANDQAVPVLLLWPSTSVLPSQDINASRAPEGRRDPWIFRKKC